MLRSAVKFILQAIIRKFYKTMIFHYMYLITLYVLSKTECCSESRHTVPKYYPIERCHRSKLGIAAKANFTSLKSCEKLGIEKKALAINFSSRENFNYNDSLEYTCEALKCAETVGGSSLSNDTRYDYYSIYAKPIPNATSTCVSATGMFLLVPEKLNHTQSEERCRNTNSVLADVTSEQRTEALGQVLANSKVNYAYVGLRRNNNNIFSNNNGEGLDCTMYRAWAPGHPKRDINNSCVVLTRNRTWKTVLCAQQHQPLCELIPGGPYKKGSIFVSRKNNITSIFNNENINNNLTNTRHKNIFL